MGKKFVMKSLWFMVFVKSVICGRVPVGIHNVILDNTDEADPELQFSDEYLSLDLDSPHNSGENTAAYITDVQINEFQNAQETKIKQDQEVYNVDPRCPKFSGFCNAPTCSSDGDCHGEICCYNGCVHTCVVDKSPPIAIDWIPLGEEKLALLSDPKQNTITISGGCKVTMNQRKGLDLFLKYGHVTKCVCQKEDVLCHVRKRVPFSSLASESSERFSHPRGVQIQME